MADFVIIIGSDAFDPPETEGVQVGDNIIFRLDGHGSTTVSVTLNGSPSTTLFGMSEVPVTEETPPRPVISGAGGDYGIEAPAEEEARDGVVLAKKPMTGHIRVGNTRDSKAV